MPTITFDGPSLTIGIGYDDTITSVNAVAIYSAWKAWVVAGNAQYPPAFAESVGGNPLGGGTSLDAYLFLRNDLGWRILPADADHTLVVTGNLFGQDVDAAVYLPRPGRTVNVREQQSSRALVSTADIDIEVPPDPRIATLEKLLRNRRETDPETGRQRIFDDDGVTVLFEGELFEDVAGTTPYRGQGADRADRLDDV